jgi:long-chain acyl-CoA synthetase
MVTVEALHALCVARLARYKRPVAIELLDELPKNHIGKIASPLRAQARRAQR